MKRLSSLAEAFLNTSHASAIAVAVIDFSKNNFECFELNENVINKSEPQIFFDYASLTKPLTNSFINISEKISDPKLDLLLNHRGDLPAWGLLSNKSWKEQILSYEVRESEVLYSDFSALRFMLEVEKKKGQPYQEMVMKNLDPKIKFWKDLLPTDKCIQNGYYGQKINIGKVHDPNAYNLNVFTSHAGLFGTIDALAKTLINFNQSYDLLYLMQEKMRKKKDRFVGGFDTVSTPMDTLAGKGCSDFTFGHLGFTGTSFWIDAEKKLGHIILTNATKEYWFDKKQLNECRKKMGEFIWKEY